MKKEVLASRLGSISGIASVLGSWQICHTICLGLISLLAIIGVTVNWMPFLFLNEIAVPVWSFAVVILVLTGLIYFKKKCISGNSLVINSGLIIAGTPFQSIQKFTVYFWIVGGLLVISGIVNYFYNRRCCS